MNKVEKTYQIKASKSEVFDALTRVDKIEQWSGATAKMNLAPDGEFSLWNGSIHGINQVVSDSKIVQLWKEASWTSYSKCIFTLKEVDQSTMLVLEHTDIPESSLASIDKGWDEYYLEPLKEMLENQDKAY